jgi:MFS family permease
VATLGTLGEWAWTHVWMPIPWPSQFVPWAIAIAVPAALCGAVIGAVVAGSVKPRQVPRLGLRSWIGATLALAGIAAVLGFCLPTHPPAGTVATIALDRPAAVASGATVTVSPAAAVGHAEYVQQLSWQRHTRSVVADLRRLGPGVYRTVKPLPVSGSWKSLIRIQQGRARGDVPVYLPADPAIPVPGIAAEPRITRAFVATRP